LWKWITTSRFKLSLIKTLQTPNSRCSKFKTNLHLPNMLISHLLTSSLSLLSTSICKLNHYRHRRSNRFSNINSIKCRIWWNLPIIIDSSRLGLIRWTNKRNNSSLFKTNRLFKPPKLRKPKLHSKSNRPHFSNSKLAPLVRF